jgi:hypothetical protein
MGGDAVLHGRPVRAWLLARGGYPVPARPASGPADQLSGPADQPSSVVAAVELASCKVPAGVSAVPGAAAGTTTVGAG